MHDQVSNEVTGDTAETLVVCVGNGLAGDDAVGEAVYEQLLREGMPDSTQLLHLGLGGLSLLEHLRGQQLLIVVDAVQLGAEPGFVHVLESDQMPSLQGQAVSVHGIGLLETLSVSRVLYPESVPRSTVLIGIEGRRYDELGVPLSPAVAAAVATAVREVRQQIRRSRPEESCK